VMRIRLLPMLGSAKNATLQINCVLGKVPPDQQAEGITLALEGGRVEFDEEVSGRTLFLLTTPGATPPLQAGAPEVDANLAPTEVQK